MKYLILILVLLISGCCCLKKEDLSVVHWGFNSQGELIYFPTGAKIIYDKAEIKKQGENNATSLKR